VRVTILASGSRGNATLFETVSIDGRVTRVLVDAGITRRALIKHFKETNAELALDAVLVTHAHRDHVGNCDVLSRFFKAPLYMSESTSRRTGFDAEPFGMRDTFTIGAFEISTLPLPHDAAQVALSISDRRTTTCLCTDLGEVPHALPDFLAGSDLLLLESNHDMQMLRHGPYPDSVKRRIASAGGHLSNAQTHELLSHLAPRLRQVVLMHLSESNNDKALALDSAQDALSGHSIALSAATQTQAMSFDVTKRAVHFAVPVRALQLSFAF
jgi:phosphoribosyl 1,2-cyclic phosphodiesterase